MTLFAILAAAAALAAAFYIARPLLAGRAAAAPRAAYDEQVLRDQLAEIDRDRARGGVSEADAQSARVEVSRRLIAAVEEGARSHAPRPAPRAASRALALAAALALPGLAGWAYWSLGAPGLPDRPLSAAALSQKAAEGVVAPPPPAAIPPAFEAELAQLRRRAESGEAAARYFLAQGLMAAERPGEAWRAYRALIDSSEVDAPAPLYAAMGEGMVMAAGGYVSIEARAAFDAALARQPDDPVALYYRGAALAQAGDARGAAAIWTGLLAASGPDAPWRDAVVARLRGIGALPPPGPGPSAAQMRAAEGMSAEDRAAMIRGMVEGLQARLEAEGGPPEDWARLIRALAVSGDMAGAQRAYEAARAAHPKARGALEAEAARAGLTK